MDIQQIAWPHDKFLADPFFCANLFWQRIRINLARKVQLSGGETSQDSGKARIAELGWWVWLLL